MYFFGLSAQFWPVRYVQWRCMHVYVAEVHQHRLFAVVTTVCDLGAIALLERELARRGFEAPHGIHVSRVPDLGVPLVRLLEFDSDFEALR